MITPAYFKSENRGTLVEVHIADIHFGVIDPMTTYNILKEQFLNKIRPLKYDILSIDGDLFHHAFMTSSDTVLWAMQFFDECVLDAAQKQATIIIIEGTRSHDAGQLKIFYQYLNKPNYDVRIIEHAQFINVKKANILCLPEEYGKGEEYYKRMLLYSGEYDSVFMHGTIKGSIYGADKEDLSTDKSPVFDINSFMMCRGPVISGHVHKAGCFNTYMYYCGSPIRWQFGEEEDKGFIILLHNLDTQQHHVHFEAIQSFRYDTVNLDAMSNSDPKDIVAYLKNLKASGIDKIRVQFTNYNTDNLNILKNYFRNDSSIVIDYSVSESKKASINANQEVIDKYSGMEFLLDSTLSEYEKFVKFVNYNEGSEFITVDGLMSLLNEE